MNDDLDDIADANSMGPNIGHLKQKLNNPNYGKNKGGTPKHTKNINKVTLPKLNLPDEYKE